MLEENALEQLQALQLPGRPKIAQRLVHTFLQNSPPQLQDLKEAILRRDYRGIQNLAASMKTASSTLGALQLAALLRDLEIKGREQLGQDLEADMSRIEKQYSRVAQKLGTLMPGEAGNG